MQKVSNSRYEAGTHQKLIHCPRSRPGPHEPGLKLGLNHQGLVQLMAESGLAPVESGPQPWSGLVKEFTTLSYRNITIVSNYLLHEKNWKWGEPNLHVEMGGLYTPRCTDHLVSCAHILHVASLLIVGVLFTYICICFVFNLIEHLCFFHLYRMAATSWLPPCLQMWGEDALQKMTHDFHCQQPLTTNDPGGPKTFKVNFFFVYHHLFM